MTKIHITLSTVMLALALIFISGCTDTSANNPPKNSIASDISNIKQQSQRFSQAYIDSNLDALIAIYSTDAVIGPSRSHFITGSNDLRKFWKHGDDVIATRHKTIPVDIIVEGDIAYDWGRYEGASGPAGKPVAFSGKYLIVWRKGDDGIWRMVQDMWNSTPK